MKKARRTPSGALRLYLYSFLKKDKVILSVCLIVARIAMPVSPFSKDYVKILYQFMAALSRQISYAIRNWEEVSFASKNEPKRIDVYQVMIR